MRTILLLFLLVGLSAQAQELTRTTDFQKQLLDYDDQSFFEYQENEYEYHIEGKHIVVTEIASNTVIYISRRTLCDENLKNLIYYNGKMILVGSLGLYIEGILDEEDQFMDYGDFEIDDYGSYGYDQINSIYRIRGYQKEITIDLDLLETIDKKQYIFTTMNSYFYKVSDQIIKENKITKDTSILANIASSVGLHYLGDKLLISLGDQKCIIIDDQDDVVAELTDVPSINTVLQPLNTDYFVVVPRSLSDGLHFFASDTYEKIDQIMQDFEPFSVPAFEGSTSSGIYISVGAAGSTRNLLFWDYQLNELQTIYDSNVSPLYIIHFIENEKYCVIQDLEDIVIIDKSDNTYFRTQNVYNRLTFSEYIKFVNINGEDKVLVSDSEGYKYYTISTNSELVNPIILHLEDGLGENIVRNGNLYFLSDYRRGLDKIEYLYGNPLALKSFDTPSIITSNLIVAEDKIYYTMILDSLRSLWRFDPESNQSTLLRDGIVDYIGFNIVGQFIHYNNNEVYDIVNDEVVEINLNTSSILRHINLVTDRYIYFKSSFYVYRMLIEDINSLELVHSGQTSLLTTLADKTFVIGTEDGILLQGDSNTQIIPYPDGYTKESLYAKDDVIVLTKYNQDEDLRDALFFDFNDNSWKSYSFLDWPYDIIDKYYIGFSGDFNEYKLYIYNTISEEYNEITVPGSPYVIGSRDDKLYVRVFSENSIRVYNFRLELQNEIELPQLDGLLRSLTSDDYNHILLRNPGFYEEEYNLADYYILNTDLDEVIKIDNCYSDVQIVDLVSFSKTVEFIGHTESLGNQLYTFELDDFYLTNVHEDQTSQKLEITISPNPTTGILTFDKKIDRLKVFSIDGKVMYENENTDTIDLTQLRKGIYILHGTIGNKIIAQKIIKG